MMTWDDESPKKGDILGGWQSLSFSVTDGLPSTRGATESPRKESGDTQTSLSTQPASGKPSP